MSYNLNIVNGTNTQFIEILTILRENDYFCLRHSGGIISHDLPTTEILDELKEVAGTDYMGNSNLIINEIR